jgi:hypothetical protein
MPKRIPEFKDAHAPSKVIGLPRFDCKNNDLRLPKDCICNRNLAEEASIQNRRLPHAS